MGFNIEYGKVHRELKRAKKKLKEQKKRNPCIYAFDKPKY